MKMKLINCVVVTGFLLVSAVASAQCDIKNRINPDGSMSYYIEPVNFYWTQSKDLKGGIVTDKENFFLELQPRPVPDKSIGKKLKSDLELKLSDDQTYQLKHYDTRYTGNDTVMEMLYLINKEDMDLLRKYEVVEAKIDMGEEGIRTYTFKLHKSALKEQLDCFLAEEEKEKN